MFELNIMKIEILLLRIVHLLHNILKMASFVIPTRCGSLQKGNYIIMENRPCKIIDICTAKTGKHGSAKAHFIGIDIFNDKKYEYRATTSQNVDVPVVKKDEYQLINIDNNSVSYLDDKGNIKDDLIMPNLCDSDDELSDKLQEVFDKENDKDIYISVLSAMGISAIKGFLFK